ncbi:hypothetical protein [Pseudovibrio exalbescens]|uniref:hypothetical protein n=1 Tax=Pseudovibrio exalbescens TaxID=197461 RepID=UPI000C99DE37|nr:hypothetical protein [Pseudovibrio exalbescens]
MQLTTVAKNEIVPLAEHTEAYGRCKKFCDEYYRNGTLHPSRRQEARDIYAEYAKSFNKCPKEHAVAFATRVYAKWDGIDPQAADTEANALWSIILDEGVTIQALQLGRRDLDSGRVVFKYMPTCGEVMSVIMKHERMIRAYENTVRRLATSAWLKQSRFEDWDQEKQELKEGAELIPLD